MKVALVCAGLGRLRRGYERFTRDLYEVLRGEIDLTLFRGPGPRLPGEVSLPSLSPDGWLRRLHGRRRDQYYFHQLSYALSLIPALAAGRYDLVHYSEPSLGNFLYHARRTFRCLRFRTVFSNAGLGPECCTRADHVHELAPWAYREAVRFGIPPERLTELPYGVHPQRFAAGRSRGEVRAELGVPEDAFCVLSVAALNRRHKRIHHLIEEVAGLPARFHLVVAGHPEEPELLTLGRRRLGPRFHHCYVDFPGVTDLYRAADVFVLGSLVEGFCLAAVEAMCAGLPVLVHRSEHFAWLVGEEGCLVDMAAAGELAARLQVLGSEDGGGRKVGVRLRERAAARFAWDRLRGGYVEMYARALAG